MIRLIRNGLLIHTTRTIETNKALFTFLPDKILISKVNLRICSSFSLSQNLQVPAPLLEEEGCSDLVKSFKTLKFSSQEEICQVKRDLALNLHHLCYEELVELVKAFKNENWIQVLQYGNLPDTHANVTAKEMFEMVRVESNNRLKSRKVGHDKFISLSSENFEKALEFCLDWAAVEKRKSKGSFVYNVINSIGDQQTAISVRRFKHFTKNGFVNFCILMRGINLAKDFHGYYCVVKFVDLFPQMTQDDLGEVCRTFCVHPSLTPSPYHPMTVTIKTYLVDYLQENLSNMKTKNLLPICQYLGNHVPHSLLCRCISIQASMFAEDLMEVHSIKSLLAVAKVTSTSNLFTRTGVDKDFLDSLVNRVAGASLDIIDNQIGSKDVAKFVEVLSVQRGTPKGRMTVLKMKELLIQRLRQNPTWNMKSCISFALNMAHMGMYDKELLEKIFMSDMVTVPSRKDGSRVLAPNLRYGSVWHESGGGADLMQLKGMVELEMPEYRGKLISEQDDSLKFIVHKTPLEVIAEEKNEEIMGYKEGYRVKKGLEIHNHLCLMWGESSVWETYLLPFTGQVNYVVRVNMDAEGACVGEHMRKKDSWEVKYLDTDNSNDVWLAFCAVHPGHSRGQQVRSGGLTVMQRLVGRLGYKGIIIDLEEWDNMGNEQREDLLRRRVQESVADSNTKQRMLSR